MICLSVLYISRHVELHMQLKRRLLLTQLRVEAERMHTMPLRHGLHHVQEDRVSHTRLRGERGATLGRVLSGVHGRMPQRLHWHLVQAEWGLEGRRRLYRVSMRQRTHWMCRRTVSACALSQSCQEAWRVLSGLRGPSRLYAYCSILNINKIFI